MTVMSSSFDLKMKIIRHIETVHQYFPPFQTVSSLRKKEGEKGEEELCTASHFLTHKREQERFKRMRRLADAITLSISDAVKRKRWQNKLYEQRGVSSPKHNSFMQLAARFTQGKS